MPMAKLCRSLLLWPASQPGCLGLYSCPCTVLYNLYTTLFLSTVHVYSWACKALLYCTVLLNQISRKRVLQIMLELSRVFPASLLLHMQELHQV